MLFALKKFIAYWLMPLPFCLTGMIIGAVLMLFTKRTRLGRGLLLGALALLVVFSNTFVSRALIRPLETQFPPVPELKPGVPPPAELAACHYIVVLGGGNGLDPQASANNLLSAAALARITEAVRLARALPDVRLIVSGPGDVALGPTHAEVLARTAESLGIARQRILKIEDARDTEEEMQAVQRLAAGSRIAVVTSAWHLPRAIALCRSVGFDPVPCPTGYTAHPNDGTHWTDFLWEIDALDRSTLAVREHIGGLWIRLRGKS
jgi:uncharacterized SAM-binding protein YcdF (DUF218 family)